MCAIETYLGQLHYKIIGIGLFCCLDNVFHGGSWFTKADIFSYGCSKQHRLLLYNTNEGAEPLDV